MLNKELNPNLNPNPELNPKNAPVTKKTETAAGEAERSSTVPTTRKLTRLTVEKWKHNGLAQYEAESWLTYDFETTKHGKYCTGLYCKVCTQFPSSIQNRSTIQGHTLMALQISECAML